MTIRSTQIAASSVRASVMTSITTHASHQNPVTIFFRASAPCFIGDTAVTSASGFKVSTVSPGNPGQFTLNRPGELSVITSAATTATLWVLASY